MIDKIGLLIEYSANFINWGDAVLDYLHIRRKDYVLHHRDGISIMLPAGRSLHHMVYEVLGLQIYTRHYRIMPGDVVVDIGGAIGAFSIYAATRGAQVYAFEPSAQSMRYLIRNSVINDVQERVHPVSAAVTRKSGTGTLYSKRSNPLGNTMHGAWYAHEVTGRAEVRTKNLAEFVKEADIMRIDLLKLDCEGCEYDILLNAPPSLMKRIKNIALEYHEFGVYKKEQLVGALGRHGFESIVQQEAQNMGFIYSSREGPGSGPEGL